MNKNKFIELTGLLLLLLLPLSVLAQERAGLVLALRGQGTILRAQEKIQAKPKADIMEQDEVLTHKASRMKLLFRDDSLLTLSELSRLVVRQYLMAAGAERSKAIYALLEGKLRAIVGRSDLEIHTTTAVAAARGTGFFIWTDTTEQGQYTGVAVFDGTVQVRSPFQSPGEGVIVEPGFMTYVFEGRPPSIPEPTPKELFNNLKGKTRIRIHLPARFRPPKVLLRRPPLRMVPAFARKRFKLGPIRQIIRDPSVESLFSIITINATFP